MEAAGNELTLSVVVPVYNEALLVRASVERLRAVPLRLEVVIFSPRRSRALMRLGSEGPYSVVATGDRLGDYRIASDDPAELSRKTDIISLAGVRPCSPISPSTCIQAEMNAIR